MKLLLTLGLLALSLSCVLAAPIPSRDALNVNMQPRQMTEAELEAYQQYLIQNQQNTIMMEQRQYNTRHCTTVSSSVKHDAMRRECDRFDACTVLICLFVSAVPLP